MDTTRETLIQQLKANKLKVTFRKADDTIREMQCTLLESYLPVREVTAEPADTTPTNPNIVFVWDLEKNSWRCFRLDRLISVETIENI